MEDTKLVHERILSECAGKPGAYQCLPFGEMPICYKVMGKIFAEVYLKTGFYKITVRCSAEKGQAYRELYPGAVVRGYHCPAVQQPYKNTVDLLSFKEEEVLAQMIEESYHAAATSGTMRNMRN